ncbi:winged helix-turn-helix transcriptional regulator [Microlunatus ginsengisoli]|uniref:Helix-turn-helix domain-containing protein n=1 Tax=Microlunatus ginsengisoli TaxID=363863 RepID=A0ABP6ZRJ6_9ACTN
MVARTYGQLCGLALALDLVGDRWSLLIVRELLVRPAGARYTDLRDGLPGIATNLLADRLRDLEAAGVVRREEPRPPVATPVFRLTERGAELRPAVEALAIWGGGAVPAAPADGEFRSRWLVLPAEAMLADRRPAEPGVSIELRTGDEPVLIEVAGGAVHARTGRDADDPNPDLVISGPPKAVLGVISGKLPLGAAAGLGVRLGGEESVLSRVGLAESSAPTRFTPPDVAAHPPPEV